MASRYKQVYDGERVTMKTRWGLQACCDCGLVHLMHYRVSKDRKLSYQVWRMGKETGGKRRAKRIKIISTKKKS